MGRGRLVTRLSTALVNNPTGLVVAGRMMEALELARSLAGGGRVQKLSSAANQLFRIYTPGGPSLIKVYDTDGLERREHRALNAVAGLPGVPDVVDRGSEEGLSWVRFRDPGRWNLATLPGNLDAMRAAGKVLKAIHDADKSALSNLGDGMTPEALAADYTSTYRRLERFRGRFGISNEEYRALASSPAPTGGDPVPSHTDPTPDKFFIDEDLNVTLLEWGWATLAPPEWDFAFASWRFTSELGAEASRAMADGYGSTATDADLEPWFRYHIAGWLVRKAEDFTDRSALQSAVDMLKSMI